MAIKGYNNGDQGLVVRNRLNNANEINSQFNLSTIIVNSDYILDIDADYDLTTNSKLSVNFPSAIDNTQNARLSIDNGATFVNIYSGNGVQLIGSEIENRQTTLYYDGTNWVAFESDTTIVGNQAYSQNASLGYFSEITEQGALSQINAKGLTLDNQVVNGDFRKGVSDWAVISMPGYTVTNGIASFTSTNQFGRIQQVLPATTGDTIFMYAYMKTTSNEVGLGRTSSLQKAHSGSGNFEWVVDKRLAVADNAFPTIIDARASAWDEVQVQEAGYINMTQLGIASLTEEEMLDLVNNGYFEGTKSVSGKYKTTGKNLLNLYEYGLTDSNDSVSVSLVDNKIEMTGVDSTGDSIDWLLKVRPNTDYVLSGSILSDDSARIRIGKTDGAAPSSGTFISQLLEGNNEVTFTTDSDTYELYCSLARNLGTATTISVENIQFEIGTVATDYEEYIEQNGTLPTLRSVDDTLGDFVQDETNGQFVTRNVTDASIDVKNASYNEGFFVGATALFYVDNLGVNWNADSNSLPSPKFLKIGDITYKNVSINDAAGVDEENTFGLRSDGIRFGIRVNNTTYPDAASFEAYLQSNPVTAYFEAANPVTEELTPELVFSTASKGSLFFEELYPELTSKAPTNLKAQVDSIQESTIKNRNDIESIINDGINLVAKAIVTSSGTEFYDRLGNLIYSVTGTNPTSIVFDDVVNQGLIDIVRDGGSYKFITRGSTSVANYARLFINGDSTLSNYNGHRELFRPSIAIEINIADSRGTYFGELSTIGSGMINLDSQGRASSYSDGTYYSTATSDRGLFRLGTSYETIVSNVSSIEFELPSGNYDVGTIIEIYKVV